ncbi:MAG: metallophosphoesterase family protein [Planctomycetes bacterium]|nr:metallophosphoesterase family protein [Planctomycetota bacterium]
MLLGGSGYLLPATSAAAGVQESTFYDLWFDTALLVAGTNVLAVEVHQANPTSSDVSFDLELIGETGPALTRGPYLQSQSETAITLCWRTNTPTSTYVRYGTPGLVNQSVSDPTPTVDHQVRLAGLLRNTTYRYVVGTTTTELIQEGPRYEFRMPPPRGVHQPIRVWVLGDCGTGSYEALAVRDAYQNVTGTAHTDLWLMLGDNAYYYGHDSEYQAGVFDVYGEMLARSCLWPALGNHEVFTQDYLNIFSLPSQAEAGGVPSGTEHYYSFDYANVHFICLDSFASDRSIGGAMWTWLRADLAANDQDWTIAYWHHPPYTKGSHDSDIEAPLYEMRERFVRELEDHGVDLVLGGHSHSYERSYLIDGHLGPSFTWDPSFRKDPGNGRPGSDGAYVKAAVPRAGAVYAVAGSSGLTGGGPLNHPAMVYSANRLGSMILEIDGRTLSGYFLNEIGAIDDWFQIQTHEATSLVGNTTTLSVSRGGTQRLALDAGTSHVQDLYLLLGSATGSSPGLPLGNVTLPLVPDGYFQVSINAANTGIFQNTLGTLDINGRGNAAIQIGANAPPELLGLTLWHAFLVFDFAQQPAIRFASHAFPVTFIP